MALTLGQFASSAGYVSEGMRTAEEAERQARQNQLKIEAQNRANEERKRMAQFQAGLQVPNMPQFQGMIGGQQFTQPGQPASGAEVFSVNMNAPQAKPLGLNVPVPAAPAPATAPTGGMTQAERDRIALLKPITAAADVIQAPAAAGLNALGYVGENVLNIGGRLVNAVTGEEILRTDNRAPSFSYTPFYDRYVREPEQAAGIRPELAKAMEKTESGGVTTAVSPKGATGLMQVMIPTAMDPGFGLPTVFEFALQQGVEVKNTTEDEARRLLKDPKVGGPYGLLYANTMSQRYGGDETLMLVAYNWGPGNADKWAASGRNPMDLPRETRDYVIKNLGLAGGNKPAFNENPSKTADNIAASITAPAAAGVMYGPSEVPGGMQNPGVQSAMMLRQMMAEQYRIASEVGNPESAMQALTQITAIDLGLFKAQGDLGVQELITSGDASRAMSVLSQFTGTPTQALARGDGAYDIYRNGRLSQTAVPVGDLADLIRTSIDAEYRTQKTELAAKRSMVELEQGFELKKITLNKLGDLQKALVEGNYELLLEEAKKEGKVTVDSTNGVVLYREEGRTFVVTPNEIQEVGGVEQRGPVARPINIPR
jgi:soluble lytic murein transglycosylase-like protein